MNNVHQQVTTQYDTAIDAVIERLANTIATLGSGLPHWADPRTGRWTTTPNGDWTGGTWIGQLWLAYAATGDEYFQNAAEAAIVKLGPRVTLETAFKGIGFYYACTLPARLGLSQRGWSTAMIVADDLKSMYDANLGLLPLGAAAEEGSSIGRRESSVDSLQAAPIMYWAAGELRDPDMMSIARAHTKTVLRNHLRADSSIIQSTSLSETGEVVRSYTHKGYSDTSVWGRAQAWGILCGAQCYSYDRGQVDLLRDVCAAADWWIAHVPDDGVSYWDFDDPDIPNAPRDTAATAMVSAALLKLADLVDDPARSAAYRDVAAQSVQRLITDYLVLEPVDGAENVRGLLGGGCFTLRPDTRPQDKIADAELVFGTYYFLESLMVLAGKVDPLLT